MLKDQDIKEYKKTIKEYNCFQIIMAKEIKRVAIIICKHFYPDIDTNKIGWQYGYTHTSLAAELNVQKLTNKNGYIAVCIHLDGKSVELGVYNDGIPTTFLFLSKRAIISHLKNNKFLSSIN